MPEQRPQPVIIIHILVYLLIPASIGGILFGLTLNNADRMVNWTGASTFYVMIALILFWGWQLGRFLKFINFAPTAFAQKNWLGAILAFIMTVSIAASVRQDFRILGDEADLVAISQSLVYERSILRVSDGKFYYDALHPTQRKISKRPSLYPFLIYLVHLIKGYTPNNAFIVNLILLYLLLFTVFAVMRSITDHQMGIAGIFLLISQPVLSICANSAGFDLLAAVMLIYLLIFLGAYLKYPSAEAFGLLWAFILLSFYARYESLVYGGVLLTLLVLCRYLKRQHILRELYLYTFSALCVIPYFWQRILASGHSEIPKNIKAFSIDHLPGNLLEFLRAQLQFDMHLPFNPIVNLFGIGILIMAVIALILRVKKGDKPLHNFFAAATLSCVGANLSIFFLYYHGQYTHATSYRFFIFISLFLALMPLYLKVLWPGVHSKVILVFAVAMFLVFHPVAMKDSLSLTLLQARKTRFVVDTLKKYDKKQIMVLVDRPVQYTIWNYGAQSLAYGRKNAMKLLWELKRNLFEDIIVVQEIQYRRLPSLPVERPYPDQRLPKYLKLEVIRELQTSSKHYVRVSRVLHPSEIPAPPPSEPTARFEGWPHRQQNGANHRPAFTKKLQINR